MRTDIAFNIECGDLMMAKVPVSQAVVYDAEWKHEMVGGSFNESIYIELGGGTAQELKNKILNTLFLVTLPYRAYSNNCYVRFTSNGTIVSSINFPTLKEMPSAFPVYANLYGRQVQLKSCATKAVSGNDSFIITVDPDLSKAIIGPSENIDLHIRTVDYQDAFLILKCRSGNLYRYPVTGVGLMDWMQSNGDYSGLSQLMTRELNKDGITVQQASISEDGHLSLNVTANGNL